MSRPPPGEPNPEASVPALLAAAMRSVPVPLLTVDTAAIVRSLNVQAERLLGFGARELVGRSVNELAAAEDVVSQQDALVRGLAGEELTLGVSWRSKEGVIAALVSLAPICDDAGLTIGLILAVRVGEAGVGADDASSGRVAGRRGAAPRGDDDDARLAMQALTSVPDAVLVVSVAPTGMRVLLANREACALFGWASGPTIGCPRELGAGDDPLAEAIVEMVARTIPEQELVIRRADGRRGILWVQVSRLEAVDAGSILVVARDVTLAREREDGRMHAEKMDAVGRLAGGVAHEFNNMLTAIGGFGDLLLEELAESDPKREDVLQIKEASDRATALTRDLLAFSARQVLQPHAIDLGELIAAAAPRLRQALGSENELVFALADSPTFVHADATQLDHVLEHLVVNARDAMPTGGRVTIATRYLPSHAPRGLHIPEGALVELSVRDTGVGMDRVAISKAFEPFFSTKASRGGGLGLSSVYGIVRQSGGHIEIDSASGEGTTFLIHLPASEPPVAVAPRGSTVAPRLRETILLLEDEEVVRALAAQVLRRHGYRVLDAADGEQGLACSASFGEGIDLLLTDLVMPRRGGLEVARELCAERPTMRVLFMSGFTEDSDVLRGLREEELAFLPKPFTPDTLLRRVREVLDENALPPMSRRWAAGLTGAGAAAAP